MPAVACTRNNTVSLQNHINLGSRARPLAYRGKGNSDPSLSEAEGSGIRRLVGMRVALAYRGKGISDPSLSEAEGSGIRRLVGMRVDRFILISDHWWGEPSS